MSLIFWAESKLDEQTKKGRLSLGSEYNKSRFQDFLNKNIGIRFKIDPFTPESRKQRGFFEGAIVPFTCYFQENLDWQDKEDLEKVREWLKIEFNGQFIVIGGKSIKVPKSTKNELNRGFLERVIDWLGEQGYPIDVLNPNEYKKYRDELRSNFNIPPTYIQYMESLGRIKKVIHKSN